MTESKAKTLAKFKKEFLLDHRAESDWRKNRIEDGKFYDGDQLSDEEKEALRNRNQPEVVINRIKPKLDSIFGMQQSIRVNTKAFALGGEDQEAEDVSEALRRIENRSNFDEQESMAFEDQCIDGRGWYRLRKEFEDQQTYICIERVDNEDVVKDRNARKPDLSDCKRISHTVYMDLEDAQNLFPGSAKELEARVTEPSFLEDMDDGHSERTKPDQYKNSALFTDKDWETFVTDEGKRVRVVTTYYRDIEATRFMAHPSLEGGKINMTEMSDKEIATLKAAHPEAEETIETKRVLNSITFTWNTLLEHKKDIREYDQQGKFPFVEIPGYVERATGCPYGLVRQMKDPQREVNKRRSKMLHLLNSTQTIYEKGAFEDEARAQKEIALPDMFLSKRKGFDVQVTRNLDVATAQFQLLQQAVHEIDTAGVNKEIEGQSSASSGKEFQLRQQQAMQSIRKLFANLREARRRVAMWCLDELIRATPELAGIKYDILIEEAPESLSLESETFAQLVSMAREGMPLPPEMLIEVSPLPKKQKDEFLQKMAAQQQAQAQAAQLQAVAAPGR